MLNTMQDPATIFRMVQKCGPQIFACVNDPDCKAALDCLQACDPTDQVLTASIIRCMAPLVVTRLSCCASCQLTCCCPSVPQVCSYQCIVTYESQLLEDFSLCILEVCESYVLCHCWFVPSRRHVALACACYYVHTWLLLESYGLLSTS